jgi:signal transduction histidine kinase
MRHQLGEPIIHARRTLEQLRPQVAREHLSLIDEGMKQLNWAADLVAKIRLLHQASDVGKVREEFSDVRLDSVVIRACKQAADVYLLQHPGEPRPLDRILEEGTTQSIKAKGQNVLLREAIVNLITNALRVSRPLGKVIARLEVVEIDSRAPQDSWAITESNAIPIKSWRDALVTTGIEVERDKRLAVISVVDRGPGVDSTNLMDLFTPGFARVVRNETKGTGLGLPIVYETARVHLGVVVVRCSPGDGAQFSLVIPDLEVIP